MTIGIDDRFPSFQMILTCDEEKHQVCQNGVSKLVVCPGTLTSGVVGMHPSPLHPRTMKSTLYHLLQLTKLKYFCFLLTFSLVEIVNAVDVVTASYRLFKNVSELVKVAGVAPTELQELGGGSQSQPTT